MPLAPPVIKIVLLVSFIIKYPCRPASEPVSSINSVNAAGHKL